MAADDTLKKIEERLTRLEATLSQGSGAGPTVPGGAVVDPAPWGGGWGGGWYPWGPHPIVDPAAYYHRPVVDPAAFHRAVVDPAPWGGGGGWGGWHPPHPIVDPAAWAARPAAVSAALGRIGPIGDPPPIDVSRFSVAQLEAALHSINAEKARLNSMETLIKQQLDKAKQQG